MKSGLVLIKTDHFCDIKKHVRALSSLSSVPSVLRNYYNRCPTNTWRRTMEEEGRKKMKRVVKNSGKASRRLQKAAWSLIVFYLKWKAFYITTIEILNKQLLAFMKQKLCCYHTWFSPFKNKASLAIAPISTSFIWLVLVTELAQILLNIT